MPSAAAFRRGRSDVFQVVGIVADAKIQGFEKDPGLVGYVPYGLNTRNGLSLVDQGEQLATRPPSPARGAS